MPAPKRVPAKVNDFLVEEFPNLYRDALTRVRSGRSVFASKNKLPAGWTPDYARLVLLCSTGIYCKLSRKNPCKFHLHGSEKKLLEVIEDDSGNGAH